MAKRIFNIVVIINLVILNIFVATLLYQEYFREDISQAKNVQTANDNTPEVNIKSSCSESCLTYIDEKITSITPVIEKEVVEREVIVTQAPYQTTIRTPKTKLVSYVPIPGSGSTLETSWTDIEGTDFYLTKVDYPGITEVYFEANMKLLNGNGSGYLRLYDVTNSRAVDGSEISTSSQTSVFVGSGKIVLWEGYNHYKVQARSLTADTTYFESGRLKIVSEN